MVASDHGPPAPSPHPPETTQTNTCSPPRPGANRANARKSTGPKTAEGKARSRCNALRHGLRAELPPDRLPGHRLLIGDRQAYRRLREAFEADLQPQGAAEQFLVERMAVAAWK